MNKSSIVAVAAVALIGATAVMAQNAPDANKGPAGKPGGHSRMMHDPQQAKNFCTSRYAGAAGHVAYLEAKLDLTAAQKPLFQKWEQSVMGSAQKSRDTCVTNVAATKPDTKPTILDRETRMEKSLSEKLDALKAQRPALEALYAALTPDQQAQFNRPIGRMGHRGEGGHGGHDGHAMDHRPGRI
ncbi:MAG: Spy/CpxP family protein refolding chaperone [Rhodospirillales bacterium]